MALAHYAKMGYVPGRTYFRFVTAINGQIHNTQKRKSMYGHFNLIVNSGEEYVHITENDKTTALEGMGMGVTKILCNNNRKVFFFLIDPSCDSVVFPYQKEYIDSDGSVCTQRHRKVFSQGIIHQKFLSLLSLPENESIMKKVDAIHFIVTKADLLGNRNERAKYAEDLVKSHYISVYSTIRYYCMRTKRINKASNFEPRIFPFSLGKFYIGGVYELDETDTVNSFDCQGSLCEYIDIYMKQL